MKIATKPTFAHVGWAERFQYAVKFACGLNDTTTFQGIAFGHYSTIVNIYNPFEHSVTFKNKVAVAFVTGNLESSVSSGVVSDFATETLAGDQIQGILCDKIKDILGIKGVQGFLEGFLVIISPKKLDVVALYTGEQCRGAGNTPACSSLGVTAGVTTMAVQVIQPRKLSED